MENKAISKKIVEVDSLYNILKESKSAYLVEYRGLNVIKLEELRNLLEKEGNEMTIYKNNISKRAFEKLGQSDMGEFLVGPNALIIPKADIISPAKILTTFAKKNKKLIVKSALVEDKVISVNEIITLATLPDKDGMIARVLGCMVAPMRNLAVVLNAVAEQK